MRRESPRSQTLFLTSTTHLRDKSNSRLSSDVKSTDTFGSIDFMSTDGHEVDIKRIDVNGQFADRLCSVRMEENLVLFAYFSDLLDRLNHTDFIVNHNCRNENRVWPDSGLELIQINDTVCSNLEIGHIEPLFF